MTLRLLWRVKNLIIKLIWEEYLFNPVQREQLKWNSERLMKILQSYKTNNEDNLIIHVVKYKL